MEASNRLLPLWFGRIETGQLRLPRFQRIRGLGAKRSSRFVASNVQKSAGWGFACACGRRQRKVHQPAHGWGTLALQDFRGLRAVIKDLRIGRGSTSSTKLIFPFQLSRSLCGSSGQNRKISLPAEFWDYRSGQVHLILPTEYQFQKIMFYYESIITFFPIPCR